MKYVYSCQVSIETETERIDFFEVCSVTRKRDAIREQKAIRADIAAGKYNHLLHQDGESLSATVDVHDAETYEFIDAF